MNFEEIEKYIREHNKDLEQLEYLIDGEFFSKPIYEAILRKVLKDKPKRVVDVGCNLGLYGYLFANKGIEYIGIDLYKYKRYETDKIKFIQANYLDVRDKFKDDVIISCLCIGYLIPVEEVKGKRLIVNGYNGLVATAKEIKLRS